MKKIYLSILILVSLSISQAYAEGVQFRKDFTWKDLLKEAKERHLYIFVDCYTTWCGPCIEMNKDVFPQKAVGDYVNGRFISIQLQMDTTENDSQHIKEYYEFSHAFLVKYSSQAYPDYLIFDADGILVHRFTGSSRANDFLSNLNKAFDFEKRSADPEIEYHALQHDLETDPGNQEILKRLAYLALRFHHPEQASQYSKKYILLAGNILDSNNMRFILETVQHVYDTNFQIMLNNPAKFEDRFGKDIFYARMQITVCQDEILPKLSANERKEQWDSTRADLKRKYPPVLADAAIAQAQMFYYSFKNDWPSFANAIDYYDSLPWCLPLKFNDFAYTVLQRCSDTSIMRRAVNWCNDAYQKEASPFLLSTHAQLLYKMSYKKEAIEFQNKAIALARADGMDKDWGIKLKDKMEKNESIF